MASKDTILANLAALDFSNVSDAAISKLMAQGIGDFIDVILQEFTNTQNSILATINNQRYGKAGYYVTKALAFQFGDNLVPTGANLDPGYAVIDPTKQIVNQAAFQDAEGSLSIKIATLNSVSGLLQQLSVMQLAAFAAYYVNMELPGIPVTIVTLPGNVFNFSAVCTFNAGYDLSTLQSNVQAALIAFNSTFQFNGILYSDQLSDYMKNNIPGIIDFFVSGTQMDGMPFVGSTVLSAGYFNYISNVFNNITFKSVNG